MCQGTDTDTTDTEVVNVGAGNTFMCFIKGDTPLNPN